MNYLERNADHNLMFTQASYQRQLAAMIGLASYEHQLQFDKAGMPYILHCLKVMHYVAKECPDDFELLAIAVGHDLLEDCWPRVTKEVLQKHFSKRIVDGIIALTKIEGEPYSTYKERVKANPDAVIVKMADLRHNTDIRRLKGITSKDFERIQKYHQFYTELKEIRA